MDFKEFKEQFTEDVKQGLAGACILLYGHNNTSLFAPKVSAQATFVSVKGAESGAVFP